MVNMLAMPPKGSDTCAWQVTIGREKKQKGKWQIAQVQVLDEVNQFIQVTLQVDCERSKKPVYARRVRSVHRFISRPVVHTLGEHTGG